MNLWGGGGRVLCKRASYLMQFVDAEHQVV